MINPADWAATPVAVQEVVLALHEQIVLLTAQVQLLTAQVQQTSQNSSKPPSSDPPSAPPRAPKTPRGRPRGGQPDHPGTQREPRPPDQIVPLVPTTCPGCHGVLPPLAPDAVPTHTHQVWDGMGNAASSVATDCWRWLYHNIRCSRRPGRRPGAAFPANCARRGRPHTRYPATKASGTLAARVRSSICRANAGLVAKWRSSGMSAARHHAGSSIQAAGR